MITLDHLSTLDEFPKEFALINGKIILVDEIVQGKSLLVKEGKIIGIANSGEYSQDIPLLNADGHLISPGLIDIHVHGAKGHTFNECDETSFDSIVQEHA